MGRGGEGAYIKNQDQIINVGMTDRASSEDTGFQGGPGECFSRKVLILTSLSCWKFNTVNSTITRLSSVLFLKS